MPVDNLEQVIMREDFDLLADLRIEIKFDHRRPPNQCTPN
jgi:hypothetical protein